MKLAIPAHGAEHAYGVAIGIDLFKLVCLVYQVNIAQVIYGKINNTAFIALFQWE